MDKINWIQEFSLWKAIASDCKNIHYCCININRSKNSESIISIIVYIFKDILFDNFNGLWIITQRIYMWDINKYYLIWTDIVNYWWIMLDIVWYLLKNVTNSRFLALLAHLATCLTSSKCLMYKEIVMKN